MGGACMIVSGASMLMSNDLIIWVFIDMFKTVDDIGGFRHVQHVWSWSPHSQRIMRMSDSSATSGPCMGPVYGVR